VRGRWPCGQLSRRETVGTITVKGDGVSCGASRVLGQGLPPIASDPLEEGEHSALARQIAEADLAAALDRGDLEDALRQLRRDADFASWAAQIRGRDELRPCLEEFADARRQQNGRDRTTRERLCVVQCDVQGDKIVSHRAYREVATVVAQLQLVPAAE
jgi:hypothetical protein